MAVDLPGFGESDARPRGPIVPHLERFAAAAVRAHAGSGPVVLVGNSLGAFTSERVASDPQVPVAGVVALDEPAFAGNFAARLFQRRQIPLLLRLALVDWPIPMRLVRGASQEILNRLMYGDPKSADPEVVALFVKRMWASRTPGALMREARALALELVDPYEFGRIQRPLLVVHGAKDRILPVRASRALHAGVPHSELVVLPHCGHCPELDDPRKVVELVTQFADKLPVGVPAEEV